MQTKTEVIGGTKLGFSDYEFATVKKQTKREKSLAEMELVMLWAALIALMEPRNSKAGEKYGQAPYVLAKAYPLLQRC